MKCLCCCSSVLLLAPLLLLMGFVECAPWYAQQAYDASTSIAGNNQVPVAGMEFDVNFPVRIYALGVFSGSSNTSLPTVSGNGGLMQVGIFDRWTQTLVPGNSNLFLSQENTTKVGFFSMADLPGGGLVLPIGKYMVVASGYSATFPFVDCAKQFERCTLGNQPAHDHDRLCPTAVLAFVGSGKTSQSTNGLVYPTGDNWFPVQFAAGTFTFAAADGCAGPPPPSLAAQAYATTKECDVIKNWTDTTVGMDFDVLLPVVVYTVGAFVATAHFNNIRNRNTTSTELQVGIFNRTSKSLVAGTEVVILNGSSSYLMGTSSSSSSSSSDSDDKYFLHGLRSPITLWQGEYSIVVYGYGPDLPFHDCRSSTGMTVIRQPTMDRDRKNCSTPSLRFVGKSRYSNQSSSSPSLLPSSLVFSYPEDLGSDAAQFAAGTFTFATLACPNGKALPPVVSRQAYSAAANLSTMTPVFNRSVGMDFEVNFPVEIYSIGVFNNNMSLLPVALQAAIFDCTTRLPVAETVVSFPPAGAPGAAVVVPVKIGLYSFIYLDHPVTLLPGRYSMVASGYSNSSFAVLDGGGHSPQPTEGNDGNGCSQPALSFVGTSRYSNKTTLSSSGRLEFPQIIGQSVAQFAAGTFYFAAVSCPQVPPLYAVQAYNTNIATGNVKTYGALGMDFDVLTPIRIFSIGAYRGNRDEVTLPPWPLQVGIYNRSSQDAVPGTSMTWLTEHNTVSVGYYAMINLVGAADVILPPGQYSIVAYGYSHQFAFVDSFDESQVTSGYDKRCPWLRCLSFVGLSRYVPSPEIVFPYDVDLSVAEFAAGTFTFAAVDCNEPVDGGNDDGRWPLKLIIPTGAGGAVIIVIVVGVAIIRWRRQGVLLKKSAESVGLIQNDESPHRQEEEEEKTRQAVEEEEGVVMPHDRDKKAVDVLLCKKIRLIGRGAQGSIYTGAMPDGSIIALKEVLIPRADNSTSSSNSSSSSTAAALEQTQRELRIMASFRHPNIITLYGSTYDEWESKLTIYMEYVPNGSLGALVRAMREPLDEDIARRYVGQITSAVATMHAQGIAHRDIKCDNILLTQEGQCKLTDFGAAKCSGGGGGESSSCGMHTIVGTPAFMAPELFKDDGDGDSGGSGGGGYGRRADVWSLGITVLEMLNRGVPPWADASLSAIVLLMATAGGAVTPPMPAGISDDAADFVRCCCDPDPLKRSTSQALLHHRWIA